MFSLYMQSESIHTSWKYYVSPTVVLKWSYHRVVLLNLTGTLPFTHVPTTSHHYSYCTVCNSWRFLQSRAIILSHHLTISPLNSWLTYSLDGSVVVCSTSHAISPRSLQPHTVIIDTHFISLAFKCVPKSRATYYDAGGYCSLLVQWWVGTICSADREKK